MRTWALALDIGLPGYLNWDFEIDLIINIYVHRIGRTGRVGNQGNSLTFLTKDDSYLFRGLFELLCKTKQKIPDFLNLGY